MRVGLSSIVGDGFGSGFFVFGEVPSGGVIPPAGTILQTLTLQTYPIAEGGSSIGVGGTNYPNQTCSVYRKADGSGGDYLDWANAFDIQYAAYGSSITSNAGNSYQVEVPTSSGNYYQGGTYTILYKHDGAGSYYEENTNFSYYADGTTTGLSGLYNYLETEVPSGTGNYYQNGSITAYTWNGSGGYNYPVTLGNYYSNGTFIYYNGEFTYYWDGNGGYYTV